MLNFRGWGQHTLKPLLWVLVVLVLANGSVWALASAQIWSSLLDIVWINESEAGKTQYIP